MSSDHIPKDVADFAANIRHCISNAKVKTATPTRSQNKIQTRIAWKNLDGTNGLGYFSVSTTTAEALALRGGHRIKDENFIDEIFRVNKWAWNEGEYDTYEANMRSRQFHIELKRVGITSTQKISELIDGTLEAIKKCVKAGKHKTARESRMKQKAKSYISGAVDFAIKNGLKDQDIRDLINEAFVRNVHEQ